MTAPTLDRRHRPRRRDPPTARASPCSTTSGRCSRPPTGPPAQVDEMIHAAHASRFHWSRAEGVTTINLARGEWQCCRVYAVLGRGEPALWHARRCLAYVEAADADGPPRTGTSPPPTSRWRAPRRCRATRSRRPTGRPRPWPPLDAVAESGRPRDHRRRPRDAAALSPWRWAAPSHPRFRSEPSIRGQPAALRHGAACDSHPPRPVPPPGGPDRDRLQDRDQPVESADVVGRLPRRRAADRSARLRQPLDVGPHPRDLRRPAAADLRGATRPSAPGRWPPSGSSSA